MVKELFFELIQVSLGNKGDLSHTPSNKEWGLLYNISCQHSLAGLLFEGMAKILPEISGKKPSVFFEWFGLQQQIVAANGLQDRRAKELFVLLKEAGYRGCVLKGQGTARYYACPEIRACGDIDIWVTKVGRYETNEQRDKILAFARSRGLEIGHVDIKHSDIAFFNDVPVEVHFLPSWMYCPSTNKRLQQFFASKAERQFANLDKSLGFAHTTIDFDLVYSMVHIYRHIFSEGIGLRQLVDYYYILQRSTEEQRLEAFEVLCQLKMRSFVGGIMWILMERFGMDANYSLCSENEKHGKFLLSEIMVAGCFGHFDTRIKQIDQNKRFKRGFSQLKRNLRFVTYYPSEVLWSPSWKLWHWCWRKKKGYL